MVPDLAAMLDAPIDGRPLHLYRISERDFDELQLFLRARLGRGVAPALAPGFVLWAAERYRRAFDGGAFSWAFLTGPLGVTLEHQRCHELTQRGLRQFRRPPPRRNAGGVQYLRTLATEGGLPVKLLAAGGHYRQALVGLVTDLERFGAGCPEDQALGFARVRAARLPFGYRTDEFHALFVDFAREIVDLRAAAPERLREAEVEAWLDGARPGWRETLTLRLDGEAARALLAEAVLARAGAGMSAPLVRVLDRRRDGAWRAMLCVAPESRLPTRLLSGIEPDVSRLRLGPRGALASACPDLMLSLEREADGTGWRCTRISGRRTAAFEVALTCPLDMVAMADGRPVGEVRLPGGGVIDPSEGPSLWTLSETGEAGGARRLDHAGDAALETRDPCLWLLVAWEESVTPPEGLRATDEGPAAGGRLWRLEGAGRLALTGGGIRVRTGADRTEHAEIMAIGERETRLTDRFGVPVFRGLPDLLLREADGRLMALPPARRRYRTAGTRGWTAQPPGDGFLGTLDVAAWHDEGVQARLRLRLMPARASLDISGRDEVLAIAGFRPGWTLRLGDGDTGRVGADGSARLTLPESARARDRVPFRAASPDGAETLVWELRTGGQAAVLADADGTRLSADRRVTISDLRDWRVTPAPTGRTELRLRLPGAGGAVPVVVPVTAEQPLSAFRALVEDLLAQGGPEAEVRLRVIRGAEQSPRLIVRRFIAASTLSEFGLWPSGRDMRGHGAAGRPRIAAVNLDSPEDVQEDVPNTGEQELRAALGPGRWFLLPDLDGAPLRPPPPRVVPGADTDTPLARFAAAAGEKTRAERVARFAGILAGDLTEDELRGLETAIEALIGHGASPALLDQVLALAQCPWVAVRLLLRGDLAGQADRLALEFHGARRWSFTAPADWGRAIAAERAHLAARLSAQPALANRAGDLAEEQMIRRVRDILRQRPDLEGHLALGLVQAGLATLARLGDWLGRVPAAFNHPEAALKREAEQAIRRHGETPRVFTEPRALTLPGACKRFSDEMRGLIETPLIISEVAFARRDPPEGRAAMALLGAMHADPGYLDAALPAAMAWQEMRAPGDGRTKR